MISAKEIQAKYNDLYVEMRKYIWDFEIVELLAELEVSIYRAFPDLDEVKRNIAKLKKEVYHTGVQEDDEDLSNRFDELADIVDNCDGIYYQVMSFKEVVPVDYEDSEEDQNTERKGPSIRVHRKS